MICFLSRALRVTKLLSTVELDGLGKGVWQVQWISVLPITTPTPIPPPPLRHIHLASAQSTSS